MGVRCGKLELQTAAVSFKVDSYHDSEYKPESAITYLLGTHMSEAEVGIVRVTKASATEN